MKRILALFLAVLITFTLFSGFLPSSAALAAAVDTSSAVPVGEEFWYRNRDFSGNYTDESEHEFLIYDFDINGRIRDDGHSFHVYDAYGNEPPIFLTYRDRDINAEYTYKLNSQGLVSEVRFFGERQEYFLFYYKSDGGFREISECLSDGTLLNKTSFDYDKKGNMTVANTKANEDASSGSSLYQYLYDSDGRLITSYYTGYEKAVEQDTFAKSFTSYRYDAAGRLIQEITCAGNDGDVNERYYLYQYVHSYDAQGRLSETKYLHGPDFDPGAPDWTKRYRYDENRQTEPENPSGQEEEPVTSTVKLIDITPKSGTRDDICPSVSLYFDHEIESINFDQGNIYLCDAETGDPVYFKDYLGEFKSVRGGSIRILADWRPGVTDHIKNCLWWDLPSNMDSSISHLVDGHTYFIRIDEGFLSFKNTDESYSMGFSNQYEWTWKIMSDSDFFKSGSFHFASTVDFEEGTQREGTASYCYDNSYFIYPSYTYNSGLAVLSMDMALAAYNNFNNYADGSKYIEDFFMETGFDSERIWTNNDYHHKPGDNTAGVAIASRKLNTGATLIAVAIRGGNYEAEWAGDFNVGVGEPEHEGFRLGKEEVLRSLETYISDYDIEGSIKIWVAGYSRASAIANLVGGALDDGYTLSDRVTYDLDDIFVYGFEVPATTTASGAGNEIYGNIYSIVNPTDLVPRMPLAQWGFRRYGKVLFLPAPGIVGQYDEYVEDMLGHFYYLYDSQIETLPDFTQRHHINKIMRDLYKAFPNREMYVHYQSDIMDTARSKLGGGQGSESVDDAFCEVLGWMLGSNGIITGGADLYNIYFKDKVKNKTLMLPHYAEYTLAWLETLDETGVLEKTEEYANTDPYSFYGMVMVQYYCPVDITVYDADGNLAASIINDVPYVPEGSPVVAYVDDDGAKTFIVPNIMEVTMDAKATGNGTMQIITRCEDALCGTVTKLTEYNELPLRFGETYQMSLDTGFRGIDYEVSVKDPYGQILMPDLEAAENAIPQSTVSFSLQGNGYVSGAGLYPVGTRAVLTAYPAEGEAFQGWYDESGELLDKNTELILLADRSRTVTARFSSGSSETGSLPKTAIVVIVLVVLVIALVVLGGIAALVIILCLVTRKQKKR